MKQLSVKDLKRNPNVIMDKVSFNWDKLLMNSTYGISYDYTYDQEQLQRVYNTLKKMKRSEKIKQFLKSI